MKTKGLKAILFVYFATLFIAGLQPFDLHFNKVKNSVSRLTSEPGIRMNRSGMARTERPPRKIFNAMMSANAMTIEAWIRSDRSKQKGPARIVSYSMGTRNRNFMLGQEGEGLVFRLRTTKSDLNGLPDIKAIHIFRSNAKQHVAAVYDGSSARLYVNGLLMRERRTGDTLLSNWSDAFHLVLGNEISGNRPWLGRIYSLALYSRALTEEEIRRHSLSGEADLKDRNGLITFYTFDGEEKHIRDRIREGGGVDLVIPSHYRVSASLLPIPPLRELSTFLNLRDLLLNILGFIPMGFLLQAAFPHRLKSFFILSMLSIAAGFFTSLSIEVLQTYSITRFPQALDILYNVTGVMIGLIGLYLYRNYRKTEKPNPEGVC